MQDTNLLGLALGLTPPWAVGRAGFDAEARPLDIYLAFAPGSRFACPECGAGGCPVHNTDAQAWRRLNFFQHQAWLHPACRACAARSAA